MGRLSLVAALALAATACDKSSDGGAAAAPSTRSESISAASTMPVASTPPSAAVPASAHAPSAPARKLCESELGQPSRKLPKGTFRGVAAGGAKAPTDRLATGNGRWTWINFFAAWCGPCKEEMPRLRSIQQRLASDLDVAFVSLDDDERQLGQFLDAQAQSPNGVTTALWLQPGKARASFLGGLNMKESPDLPAHVLVDPSGKVRCIAGGAVEDSDFSTIAAIVKR